MAVLVLAIGIGVNVAAFSVFDMVALKPLPVRDPRFAGAPGAALAESLHSEMPYLSLVFYEKNAKTLSAVIAVLGVPPMQMDDDLQPASALHLSRRITLRSWELPRRLAGCSIRRGRATPARPGGGVELRILAAPVRWRPGVVGRTIQLNKKPATVIGVTSLCLCQPGRAEVRTCGCRSRSSLIL